MKYSLNQIKRYVPALASIEVKQLVNRIWESVAEVEKVEFLAEKYEGIVVSRVLTVEKHPKSEKLVVVTVDIGSGDPVIVVTAAQNLQVGQFVPYIPVGVAVPASIDSPEGKFIIGVRPMVGIDSIGMLASERELLFSDDHSGIMILYPDELRGEVKTGMSLAEALELDDVIIEIENKTLTHRGDCFSAAGLAREIATLYDFELQLPDWQIPGMKSALPMSEIFDKEMPCSITISVTASDAVDRYSAVVLDGITVSKSPLWLRTYLWKHGVNSVNNVVDITNYVMLDYGQPMHAFDAGVVAHRKRNEQIDYPISVRYAKGGEKIEALDSKEKVLDAKVAVIADTKRALAIAGIIGGKVSGITETTTRIVLESAVFDKYAIRNASMSIGSVTDASVVFSRKQDPEKTVRALLRAVHLLQEIAGAIVVSQISDEYPKKAADRVVVISHEKAEHFIGISISPGHIETSLTNLGMQVTKKNGLYSVTIPSWRPDIAIDEDLYEEIARTFGYHNISLELPKRGIFGVKLNKNDQLKQQIIKTLTGYGFLQTMNFTFASKALYEQCHLSVDDSFIVTNAISPDVQYIRKYVSPGVLAQLAKNQYNAETFGLFEIGKVARRSQFYTSVSEVPVGVSLPQFGVDELGLPIEDEHLVLAIADSSKQPGYFSVKSYLEKYLKSIRVAEVAYVHPSEISKKDLSLLPEWVKELQSSLRSGRTAIILVKVAEKPVCLGIIGEPNTLVARDFGYTKNVGICELSLSVLSEIVVFEPLYLEPSKYPSVIEDFCVETPDEVSYQQVAETVLTATKNDLVKVSLQPRDIYQKVAGTKQTTVRVTFEPQNATVTDEEMKKVRQKIATLVAEKLDGKVI